MNSIDEFTDLIRKKKIVLVIHNVQKILKQDK